ncbi:MAG TPA: hypothetical protein EYP32_04160 [Aquificaceae bacterium]|nr:hypothetical protein [Aquificaceae bacterium]
MLEKIKKDIFFVSRLFVVLYLSLFLLISYKNYIPALILGIYFLNNIYIYFFSRPKFLRILATIFDVTLIPLFVFFSEIFLTLYALTVLISLYAWRKVSIAFLLVIVSSILALYYFYTTPLILTANLLLFLGVFFSSYNFEYATVIGKERRRILKLKKDYHILLKEFSNFEKEKRMFGNLRKIFKLLRESKDPKEYLSRVREEFNVRRIRVIPINKLDNEITTNYEEGTLIVNVKLDKGYAQVIFELDYPFRLKDQILITALIESAKLLSVMVEGFEERQEGKQALVVG